MYQTPLPAPTEPYYKSHPITTTAPCVPKEDYPEKARVGSFKSKLKSKEKIVAEIQEKEGNNPMNTNTNLNLTVDASASGNTETRQQRDYLLSQFRERFDGWRNDKREELAKLFKIYGPTKPQSAADLVAAIKADKFTIDQKKIDVWLAKQQYYAEDEGDEFDAVKALQDNGTFFAMTFTDFPEPDHKAFNAALTAWEKAKQATKDLIMVSTPIDGLAAMNALTAWQPTGLAN